MRRHSWLPLTVLVSTLVAGTTSPAGAVPAPAGGPVTSTVTGTVATAVPGPVGARVPAAVSTAAANTRIARVLRTRATSPVLGSHFTLSVWDTATKAYVRRTRTTASVRGASTTKILTSAAALATLGPAHRMPTTVRTGTSERQVVLVAGGDPLLSSANLRTLARRTVAALAARGPLPSTLDVRADDSLFTGSGVSRGWRSGWVPEEVRPVGAFARDDREVRDSTADAAGYFARALRDQGVAATYRGRARATATSTPLARYAGHTIGAAVSRALLVSDNDTAEMLFRQVAVGRGEPATWAGARRATADALRELRIPLANVRIIDGSGLSLDGRLTARALSTALVRALSPAHTELAGLRGWLPVAGRTGTLKASSGRFRTRPTSCAAGRIQAKTGTLADAIALAGYARGADGRTKVFVAIVNSRPTRYSRATTRTHVDRVAASVTGCW